MLSICTLPSLHCCKTMMMLSTSLTHTLTPPTSDPSHLSPPVTVPIPTHHPIPVPNPISCLRPHPHPSSPSPSPPPSAPPSHPTEDGELHIILTKGSKGVTWKALIRGHTQVVRNPRLHLRLIPDPPLVLRASSSASSSTLFKQLSSLPEHPMAAWFDHRSTHTHNLNYRSL